MAFGKLTIDWRGTIAAIWRSNRHFLKPISNVDLVNPDTLVGIDEQKETLFRNTENFLRGKPASHALLWGACGVGKSSLIKALLTRYHTYGLRMIQIPKEDLHLLVDITDEIADSPYRFIVYCDDLTLEANNNECSMLKSAVEGTLEKPLANVLIYGTALCRRSVAIPQDADNQALPSVDLENTPSLFEYFGLSLAFEPMSEEIYLNIVDNLFKGRVQDTELLRQEAISFAVKHGGPSGRVAWHFFNRCHAS